MTHAEPERLALQLQELIERRATLRAILEQRALHKLLTAKEGADIQRVIQFIDHEMTELRQRLESLRPNSLGAGGTGR